MKISVVNAVISDLCITRHACNFPPFSFETEFNTVHFTDYTVDDYAKDGGPGEVQLLCSLYHEPLRNKFAISSLTAFKLGKYALIKVTCEFQLHILPNRKVSAAKDHGQNYIKFRPPLALLKFRCKVYSYGC